MTCSTISSSLRPRSFGPRNFACAHGRLSGRSAAGTRAGHSAILGSCPSSWPGRRWRRSSSISGLPLSSWPRQGICLNPAAAGRGAHCSPIAQWRRATAVGWVGGLLDGQIAPGDRITPDRVRLYVRDLEAGNPSRTVIARIIELKVMAAVMDPEKDWSWIYRFASAVRIRHKPARPKRHRLVHTHRLLELGVGSDNFGRE
jgi:hypothetical protein